MSCPPAGPSLDICPTQDEIIPQLLALLPRGRAWRTHERIDGDAKSWIYRYFYSLANVWAWVNKRICDLRKEFFCATARETLDLWMAEFGLPDGCDPFPDLCAKVAAVGGTRCDYYAAIAARAGWSIDCANTGQSCGAQVGCSQVGCSQTGGSILPGAMAITVSLSKSTAFGAGAQTQPKAGILQAGMPLACVPDISALECLITRVVGAHALVTYEEIQ